MGHILPSFVLYCYSHLVLTSRGFEKHFEYRKSSLNKKFLNKYLLFLNEKEKLMFIVTPSNNSYILQVENLSVLPLALTYLLKIFITLK